MPMIEGTFSEISPTPSHELSGVIAQVAAAMDARSAAGDLAGGIDWRRRAGIVAGYREAFGPESAAALEAQWRSLPTRPVCPWSRLCTQTPETADFVCKWLICTKGLRVAGPSRNQQDQRHVHSVDR